MVQNKLDEQLQELLSRGLISPSTYEKVYTNKESPIEVINPKGDKVTIPYGDINKAENDYKITQEGLRHLPKWDEESPITGIPNFEGKAPLIDIPNFEGKAPQVPASTAAPADTAKEAAAKPQTPAAKPDYNNGIFTKDPYKLEGNTAYGPTNANKFLSPGEVGREQQLGASANKQKEFVDREAAILTPEQDAIAKEKVESAQKQEAMLNNQVVEREAYFKHQQELQDNLYKDTEAFGKSKIDPNRWWNNKSNGEKFIASLGIVLGGLGAGLGSGRGDRGTGPNLALATMNQMIDRDISAQEQDMKAGSDSLNKRKGLLTDRWEQFKDMDLAKSAARMDYLNLTKLKVDSITSKNASEKTLLAADKAKAEIDNALQTENYKFSQLADQRAQLKAKQAAAARAKIESNLLEEAKARRDSVLKAYGEGKITNPDGSLPSINDVLDNLGKSGGDGKYKVSSGSAGDSLAFQKEKDLRERTVDVIMPNGTTQKIIGRDNKAADTISEAAVARQNIKALIDEARALHAQYGSETFPTEVKARRIQMTKEMLGYLKKIDQLGTLDKGVERIGEAMIPDLNAWNATARVMGEDPVKAKLDGLEKKINTNIETVVKNYASSGTAPATSSNKNWTFKPNK